MLKFLQREESRGNVAAMFGLHACDPYVCMFPPETSLVSCSVLNDLRRNWVPPCQMSLRICASFLKSDDWKDSV